ncbi:MAG: molecular chaperone HtpG, partial [Planctomycetes bacterium]|nr:molecular chaperone HtpG [Planctomycetota bacterium]
MTTTAEKQEFTFQAEIEQLLHILSESLYQNREIAIRELVSNASDALDKMRHVRLTDEQYRDDEPLEMTLEPNAENRTLTIRDNGIGMTRDELIENLGTIAHSGSLAFLNRLSGDARADLSLIGRFGVGFYSAFMLGQRVEVLSRSYREEAGWRWESDGSGRFTIEPHETLARGTAVTLHLKPDLDEFTRPERLKHIVRKYSTFVPHPVKLNGETLNEQRPIWVEPKTALSDDDYAAFYRHISHRVDEKPLWRLHLSSDSPLSFHAILFCPPTNLELLGFGRIEHGLSLCAKRILVQDDCRELLPEYLRFIVGLVDSDDLPLNVARESLQDNTIFRKIRRVLVKRVLDHLAKLAEDERETYETFYRQFGPALREGVATDFEYRESVAALLRFRSSREADAEALVALDQYVERMPEGQTQVYFLGGPDRRSLDSSPHLEAFRDRSLEVLLVTDPIDEIVLATLGRYRDKPLVSIDSAEVELPAGADKAAAEAEGAKPSERETTPSGFGRVLTLFREALRERVEDVRESSLLTGSPCRLVNPKGAASAQVQKLLATAGQELPLSRRVLEVNPRAPLIRRLCELSANAEHEEFIRDCGRQLHANVLLLEGLPLSPAETASRVERFLTEL